MGAQDHQAWRRASLQAEARREAERHKWIQSQKNGSDLGDAAISEWYRNYWPHYCRCRRIEHVQGNALWQEFEEQEFGRLNEIRSGEELLLDRILDRILAGHENLDIITWALDWGLPMDRVIEVLTRINVNRARMEPVTA